MNMQTLFLGFLGTGTSAKPLFTASVLAALIGIVIIRYLGMETLFMLSFATAVIALFEVNKYIAKHPDSDCEEITIDDAAGMWMSMMITLSTAATLTLPYGMWIGLMTALGAFVLFQQWKPSTIGWMHRTLKGGWGVVLSSLLSGIAGGLLGAVVLMGLDRVL
ncbi:MAG: phosphatidylglycerophosphatase A [Sulfurovum sp.]|nr:phosphatidylglycerophosphatase A [Sulfurovum sp.]